MIRGVLFDLDNTLLDFMRVKRVSIEAAAAAMVDAGMPLPWKEVFDEIYRIYGEVGIAPLLSGQSFLLGKTLGDLQPLLIEPQDAAEMPYSGRR